jgi:succinate dehydrogenase hydrophobic membrane anchor protein
MVCVRVVRFRKQRNMRLSTTKLSGRREGRLKPALAMKVTKAATTTSTIQESRFVESNARDGLREWRLHRLTAIAVIPLCLYFAASVVSLAASERKTAADWLSLPVPLLVAILVVLAGITHALIGVRAVVLDYVHTRTGGYGKNSDKKRFSPLDDVASASTERTDDIA